MVIKRIKTDIKIVGQQEETEMYAQLRNAATEAAHKAYAPYSKFHVGAAVRLETGEIITGNNQENAAYPSGLCAERVAIFYANAQYPNSRITHLMICAETEGEVLKKPITPCGACRQVIIEKENTQGAPIEICLAGADETFVLPSASDLMPLSFVSDSLINK